MYAVVRSGGKQYTVREGDTLFVEKVEGDEGSTVELTDVLLVSTDAGTTVGAPTVAGAKVRAEIVAQTKGPKIIVFKYKPKIRYRKKTGHRQQLTRLSVKEIVAG